VRLYVNGQLLVNDWVNRTTSDPQPTGIISLQRGINYKIEYQYFESNSRAEAYLSWSNSCQGKAIIPASQLFSS